jgi:arsenate reductase
MIGVLCLCVHNSARSQIAEAFFRELGGDLFEVESAGLEPGTLNPFVVRALQEDGIDIAGKKTQSVFDLYKAGRTYRYVITVCSKEAAERCPIFPGGAEKLHWPFPDPSTFRGSDDEVMEQVRAVRDAIRDAVAGFIRIVRAAAS